MKMNLTPEQAKKRNAFADALEAAAKLADGVQSGGWDTPVDYIREQCGQWARQYRVKWHEAPIPNTGGGAP